ncbi:MAG: hypothetical protein GY860_17745, partial [Desulfobacteraceae bacterium]|nr:hypothetical protein [Desulfobacteraceae bacterium]
LMAVVCFMVIASGITGMSLLGASRQKPAQKEILKKSLSVATIPVVKQDAAVPVIGYGQAFPVHLMEISPRVSGTILEKNKTLDQGGRVEQGEVLFTLDATNFIIEAEKAAINIKLRKNQVAQLQVSHEKDQGRLAAVIQNTLLSKAGFSRLKTLYEKDRVGTLSGVEQAEQSYNSLLDTQRNLEKAIALYPLQISEAQNELAQARSDLKTAKLNVKRCVITAPFSGRFKEESIEVGTYINLGTTALTLADDRIIEIQVPLSDKEAFEKLGLRKDTTSQALSSNFKKIDCRVETMTGKIFASVPGIVHRIVKYDSSSRTLYLAVRVNREKLAHTPIPVMDGMFCKVSIKGKPVQDAVRIPGSALNPDNTVYLARNNRLTTLPVVQIMEEGDNLFISGNFEPLDQIITTPLSDPIENSLLDISNAFNLSQGPSESTKHVLHPGKIP